MNEKYLRWLKLNKKFLKIDQIEKEIQCPFTTLQQFVAGNRELPEKWHSLLVDWIKSFRKL